MILLRLLSRVKGRLKHKHKAFRSQILKLKLQITHLQKTRSHLKIVFLNVGPNLLECLGSGNFGSSDEGLHLRRDSAGLHDASERFPGGRLRDGGRSDGAQHAQVSRRRRMRKPEKRERRRKRGLGQRHSFAGEKDGEERRRHRRHIWLLKV